MYYESPLGAVEERILNVMYNLLVCCREQKEDEQSRSRARAFGFACICRFSPCRDCGEIGCGPWMLYFFLSDGRDPVDLPSTWAEARVSADTFCREQFEMLDEWCIGGTGSFPESLLDDARMDITSELCDKLRQAVLAGCGTLLAGRSSSLEDYVCAAPLRPVAMSILVECVALHR